MSDLPGEMWFGTTEGQWPIHCWESEAHAMTWLREAGTERRRLWRARVVERTGVQGCRAQAVSDAPGSDMKRFLSDLAAAVREVFHPQPWDPPERDETTPEVIAGWIASHRHPDACQTGGQCERNGLERW